MTDTPLPDIPPSLAGRGVFLRRRRKNDEDFLCAVYIAYRWEEVAATGWPEPVRLAFLHDQERLQRAHYDRAYPGAAWGVIEVAGQKAGRLYLHFSAAALHIIDISFLPAFRNQGIGGALLAAVIAQAQGLGAAKVSLQVERHNPARRLYERLGFVTVSSHTAREVMERAVCQLDDLTPPG